MYTDIFECRDKDTKLFSKFGSWPRFISLEHANQKKSLAQYLCIKDIFITILFSLSGKYATWNICRN